MRNACKIVHYALCRHSAKDHNFEVSFNFGNLAPDCLFYYLRSKVAAQIVIAAKLELRPQIDTNCSDLQTFEQPEVTDT